MKIAWTTLEVVCSPTDCALPLTLKPSRQPITAMTHETVNNLLAHLAQSKVLQ